MSKHRRGNKDAPVSIPLQFGVQPPSVPSQQSTSKSENSRGEAADAKAKHSDAQESRPHRQVNGRLVLVTLLVVGVGAVCTHFLHAFQVDRTANVMLTRAQGFLPDEPEQARNWLAQYLSFRPDDGQAKLQYARLLDEVAVSGRQWLQVFLLYEDVLRQHPDDTDIRRRQVDVALRLGRFADALLHLDRLLNDDPNQGELQFLRGLALEAEGNALAATAAYDASLRDTAFTQVALFDSDFTRRDAYIRCAHLLEHELDEPEQAAQLYEVMIEESPESAAARVARAKYHAANADWGAASADAKAALTLEPGNAEVAITLAEITMRSPESCDSDRENSREALSHALRESPDEPRLYELLARFAAAAGETEVMLATLRQGVENCVDSPGLELVLADELVARGELAEAHQCLAQLQADERSPEAVEYIAGRLALAEGDTLSATLRLQSVMQQVSEESALARLGSLHLAECYGRLGRLDEQLFEYRRAEKLDPLSQAARLGVARTLARLGRIDEALEVYRVLGNDPPDWLEWTRLEWAQVMRQPPGRRRWQFVEQAWKSRDADATNSEASLVSEAVSLRAAWLLAQGDAAAARQRLEQARRERPDDPVLWAAEIRLALAEEDRDRAEQLLAEAKVAAGPTAGLVTVETVLAIQQGDKGLARLEGLASSVAKLSPEDQIAARVSLAEGLIQLGDRPAALEQFLMVAEKQPDNAQSWFNVLLVALDVDRDAAAVQAVEQLRRIGGADTPLVLCGQAMLRIREVQQSRSNDTKEALGQAKTWLERALQTRSQWALAQTQLGRVHLLLGQRRTAADQFQAAIRMGANDPALLRRTVALLYEQQRHEEARQLTQTAMREATGTARADVAQLTAEVLMQQSRVDEAVAVAREAVARRPQEPSNLIWLGQILAANGQFEEAETKLSAAVDAAPSEPTGWIALVQLLMQQERRDDALAVVQQAEQSFAGENRDATLGFCHEITGQLERADSHYRKQLQQHPGDSDALSTLIAFYLRHGRGADAEPLLREILQDSRRRGEIDLLTVRRLLALAIGSRDYPGFEEALNLLDQNRAEAENSWPDARLKARLLLTRPHPDHVKEAVELFERVARAVELSVEEAVLLAQAYDQMQREESAEQQWNKVLREFGGDDRVQVAYVRRQLRHDELGQAEKTLAQLQPDSEEVVQVACLLAARQGQFERVLKLLSKFVNQTVDPAEQAQRELQATQLLVKLAGSKELSQEMRDRLADAAEVRCREGMPANEQYAFSLAKLLGQSGQMDQAWKLLFEKRDALNLSSVLGASVVLAQQVAVAEETLLAMQTAVQEELQQVPDSLFHLHLLEAIYRTRGHYSEAISLNRRMLTLNPRHVVVLNNLAWLLSVVEGQHDEAEELLARAMQTAGPLPDLLDTRGLVRLRQRNFSSAIQDFHDAIAIEDSPLYRLHLAHAYHRSGNSGSARFHLRKAIKEGLSQGRLEQPDAETYEQLTSSLEIASSRD